jgi:hypothetical protein
VILQGGRWRVAGQMAPMLDPCKCIFKNSRARVICI